MKRSKLLPASFDGECRKTMVQHHFASCHDLPFRAVGNNALILPTSFITILPGGVYLMTVERLNLHECIHSANSRAYSVTIWLRLQPIEIFKG